MSAWVAVDKDEREHVFMDYPTRDDVGFGSGYMQYVWLPSGSIEKLIGRKLTWSDEPVELKEE